MANEEDLEERIGKLDQRIGELEERQRSRLATWAPVLVSLVAAVVSVTSLVVFDIQERWKPPAVELILPLEARLAQIQNTTGNEDYSVGVYLQPAFVNTGRSQRVEVLKSVNLYVKREGGPEGEQQCKKFWLDRVGSFTSNPGGTGLTFTYERGAAPLLVTQDTPQDHVLAFQLRKDEEHPFVEDPFFVGKQHYLMTLVAKTTTKPEPLRGTIRVLADQAVLEKRAARYLEGPPQSRKKWVWSGASGADTPDDCRGRASLRATA